MTTNGPAPALVSVHGGHSADFCSHARDTLEEVVAAYYAQGFAWVGITEHMPSVSEELVPPEERDAGLDARAMHERFLRYMITCRTLQADYRDKLPLFVAFEVDTCGDYLPFVQQLIETSKPDYIVGSVHHVRDIVIDASAELYAHAAGVAGGVEQLYCDYFDRQYEMLCALRPAVVGHFDLIRMFDRDYVERLRAPAVATRIERNLAKIRELGSIIDFNVRALAKGQAEPYVSGSILDRAHELGICVVPGDDSHGVASVGAHLQEGIDALVKRGFDTAWATPSS